MTAGHLDAIATLLGGCELSAYFNSWCASASVNHFHCHLIDEVPPVATLPLVPGATVLGRLRLRPDGFPGECHVFSIDDELDAVADVVRAMQADNQPHNLVLASGHVYVFPKPLVRPARSFELYPETVGGPELAGSFTVYREDDYEALSRRRPTSSSASTRRRSRRPASSARPAPRRRPRQHVGRDPRRGVAAGPPDRQGAAAQPRPAAVNCTPRPRTDRRGRDCTI